MPSDTPSRADLLEEFYADEQSHFDSGRPNNITDLALSIFAVLASLAATIVPKRN